MKQANESKESHNLSERLIELEQTKKAMMNVLEDLESEKEKIAKEKSQDDAILASIGEGLVVTDTQGKIILVNKIFEQMLDLKSADVIGKSFVEIVPAIDRDGKMISADERPLIHVLHGASESEVTSFSLESFQYRSKERWFPVAIKATPILMQNVLMGAVEVFRDVTKEQEIDRAKSEFVSLAGHQLRTPISVINWYTELLTAKMKQKVDSTEQTYLDAIYEASKRMGRLVNELLNVSRVDVGTLIVEPIPIDFVTYLKELLEFVKTSVHVTEQKCQFDLVLPKEKIPLLNLDSDLLHQVFFNVLTNAVNYSPKSDVCRVTITIQAPSDGHVVVSIADQGIGIPRNAQSKIFDRMFRADNAVLKVPDGNGLGLYLAKKILSATGGDIWFESEEGKGTTFYVSIPLAGMKTKNGTKKLAS